MMKMKRALITGIRGQDGSYLAEYLYAHGYQVLGTSREFQGLFPLEGRAASIDTVKLDLTNTEEICQLLESFRPDEIYNLAAMASSSQLFADPIAMADANGLAVLRFLEIVRTKLPQARFCQAGSSEVFAGADSSPQTEATALRPVNPYGAAKAFAMNMVSIYRSRYGLQAGTAILFNHESPRRPEEFVTRKITRAVAMIAAGCANSLTLGNLDSRRDWGYAGDYVQAMWMMLQAPTVEDHVIASGATHDVREFCDIAFSHAGLDYRKFVRADQSLARHEDLRQVCGDASKAARSLGWRPTVGFKELVCLMVDADRRRLDDSRKEINVQQ